MNSVIYCYHRSFTNYLKKIESIEDLKSILETGVNPNEIYYSKGEKILGILFTYDSNCTLLRYVCQQGLIDYVKLLVRYGADVNLPNVCNCIPLAYTIRQTKNLELVKYLVEECGSTLDLISNHAVKNDKDCKSTLLHFCAIGIGEGTSSYQILTYLLSLGKIDPTIKNGEGKRYVDYLV